jgi:pyrrolidone-carboxylate peptidase
VISQAHLTQPTIWIAFGEGTDVFQVETIARNARGPYRDNKDEVPALKQIDPKGAQELEVDFSTETLANRLRGLGYDCRSSSNAGKYLCEEMLYSLLDEKNSTHSNLKEAIFIHVPVEGSNTRIRGEEVPLSGNNVKIVAHDLFESIAAALAIPGPK